jgi:hypothetical protein
MDLSIPLVILVITALSPDPHQDELLQARLRKVVLGMACLHVLFVVPWLALIMSGVGGLRMVLA